MKPIPGRQLNNVTVLSSKEIVNAVFAVVYVEGCNP